MDTENKSVGSKRRIRRRKSKQVKNNTVTNSSESNDRHKPSSETIGLGHGDVGCKKVAVKSQPDANQSVVALDCEMVGVGYNGNRSILARVSIVNEYGEVIIDKYVKPTERVTDYRTVCSGITPKHIKNAHNFADVRTDVRKIIFGKILVGHALNHDMQVLKLSHPPRMIRDTAEYEKCREFWNGYAPPLSLLAKRILGWEIQSGEHCSIEDAQATMAVYQVYAQKWEASLQPKGARKKPQRDNRAVVDSTIEKLLPEFAEAKKFWMNKADIADAERSLYILLGKEFWRRL